MGVHVAFAPFAVVPEVLFWSTVAHALSEQSWNETEPVSAVSGSENVAESCGVVFTRAATAVIAGTSGKPFAVGCQIFVTPSLLKSVVIGTPVLPVVCRRQYWTKRCSSAASEIAGTLLKVVTMGSWCPPAWRCWLSCSRLSSRGR